jgi:hypothetical protein
VLDAVNRKQQHRGPCVTQFSRPFQMTSENGRTINNARRPRRTPWHQFTATSYVLQIIKVRAFVLIIMVPTTIGDAARPSRSSCKGNNSPMFGFTHHTAPSKYVVARQLSHLVCFLVHFDVWCSLVLIISAFRKTERKKKVSYPLKTSHCDVNNLSQSVLAQSPHLTALFPVPLGLLAQGPPIPQTRPPQGLYAGIATNGTGCGFP